MPRLLITQRGVARQLASVNVSHDGSLVLSLMAAGAATRNITVHTSGRVNYHLEEPHTRFLPCLLDLGEKEAITTYEIPGIATLPKVNASRKDDWVMVAPLHVVGPWAFAFSVLPLPHELVPSELGRFGVEAAYGLCWAGGPINSGLKSFSVSVPDGTGLQTQAIPEEDAYLRFRKTMFARDLLSAIETSPDRDRVTAEHIQAAILRGPGLFPPNVEGIWMIVTAVPMRIAPKLVVEFEQPHLQAEAIELRQGDTRLNTVRVRFKVFDTEKGEYVKRAVPIKSVTLHAEL